MNNTIIEVKNLNKEFFVKQKSPGFIKGVLSVFNPQYKHIKAVNDISFQVRQGELVAFIGPNGAGKSTTIKMLSGILFPTSGVIRVFNINPTEKRQQLAYQIGTVFGQKSQLWYHLPPIDTYNLFARIYELNFKEYKKRLKFLVETFSIKDLLETPIRKLSLGQRMKCEIVASLLHKPKIIFLDEPTIGLDIIAKQNIREAIKFFNEEEKVTIFLTSHDVDDIEIMAKRTIVVNFGKIIFDDATEKLKKNYLKTKIIELAVNKPIEHFEFDGGTIISQSKYNLKIELDVSKGSVEKLLSYAIKNLDILDMNIYDPSMEEVIAAIYKG